QRREQWLFAVYTSSDGVRWSQLLGATRGFFRLTGQVGVTAAAASASFRDLATIRRQTWYFPSPYDCLSCHNQNAGTILGVNARQLNRDLPGGGNQLLKWQHLGMFPSGVTADAVATSPRLTPMSDAHAPLMDRARSWLDVNCGYCHRPGGAGGYF